MTGAVFLVLAVVLMSSFQFNPDNPQLAEYDSYYHVKMAELIRDRGLPREFPWLQYTTLRDHFVDLHLLFHILLIPFVTLLGPITGAKVFQILVVSLAFLLFLVVLIDRQVRGAVWLATFALYVMPSEFYLRMSYIRNMGLSLVFLMAAMLLMFRDRPLLLGTVAFLYVWTYGGFVFLPILVITYGVAQVLAGEPLRWKLVAAGLAGTALGLVVNPYFPRNLEILATQLFHTGLGAQLYSGGEWYPYDAWQWAQLNAVPLLLFFGGILVALVKPGTLDAKAITVFIFALFFLALVWKSKRFVEYSPVFLVLSACLLLKPFIDEKVAEYQSGQLLRRAENLVYGLGVAALVAFAAVFAFGPTGRAWYLGQIPQARRWVQTLFSMSALQAVHAYLRDHARPGDIVFTDDWEVFPRYFFVNDKTYYVVGLDPEFMNQYDGPPYEGQKGRLYREFAGISSGADAKDLGRIRTHFKAAWVIIRTSHRRFYENLKAEPALFEEVLFARNDPARDTHAAARNDGYYLFRVRD